MESQIDHKIIEAAMRQGRLERAYALQDLTRSISSRLYSGVRTLMTVFVC